LKLQQDQQEHDSRTQLLEQAEQETDELQERCPSFPALNHSCASPALTFSALVRQGVHECERSDEEGEEEDEVGDGIMSEMSIETTFLEVFDGFKAKFLDNLQELEHEAK